MNTLRQEFCNETNTPMGLDNEFDYIRWLEAKIQALRTPDTAERSEQLLCVNCKSQNVYRFTYTDGIGCNSCGHQWAK